MNCFVCLKSAVNCCSKCKVNYYCNKECQKLDWKTHKLLCDKINIGNEIYQLIYKQIRSHIDEFSKYNLLEIVISETWDEFGASLFQGYPHIIMIKGRSNNTITRNKKLYRIIFSNMLFEFVMVDFGCTKQDDKDKTVYFEIQ